MSHRWLSSRGYTHRTDKGLFIRANPGLSFFFSPEGEHRTRERAVTTDEEVKKHLPWRASQEGAKESTAADAAMSSPRRNPVRQMIIGHIGN